MQNFYENVCICQACPLTDVDIIVLMLTLLTSRVSTPTSIRRRSACAHQSFFRGLQETEQVSGRNPASHSPGARRLPWAAFGTSHSASPASFSCSVSSPSLPSSCSRSSQETCITTRPREATGYCKTAR